MSAHQNWLEAPYRARDDAEAAWEAYCEANDIPEDERDDVSQDDVDQWIQDMEDDAAEEAAERARDYAMERDWDDRY